MEKSIPLVLCSCGSLPVSSDSMSKFLALSAVLGVLCGSANAFSVGGQMSQRHNSLHSLRMSSLGSEYTIAVLGDLHFDPRFMDDHIEGRQQVIARLNDGTTPNKAVVSLGDLGESKSVVAGSSELFAGTTDCFKLAREYLDGFEVPFEVRF
jgi:hypothetical protein